MTLTVFLSVVIWVRVIYSSFNENNIGLTRVHLSATGALAAISVMAMLQNTRLVTLFKKTDGRMLSIFLVHIPMLVAVMVICGLTLLEDPHLITMALSVTIIAATLYLGLHKLLPTIGAGWFFIRPARVVRMTMPGQRALQHSQSPSSLSESEAPRQPRNESAS